MIKDGHISPFQLFSLFFILIIGKQMDSSVLILTHWGHNAAALLMIICETLAVVMIGSLIPLFKNPTHNLIDHLYAYFGSIFGSIFSLIIFIALLLDLSINMTFDTEQARTVFLPTTPVQVTLFVFIFSMFIPVYFGIEVLGRSNSLAFGIILLILIFSGFGSFSIQNINNIPPILGPGIPELLKQGLLHTGFFGEFIAYLMMRPYIRSYTSYKRVFIVIAVATLGVGSIQLLILQLSMPYPIDDQVFFPFIDLVRMIYFGRFFQHIEAVYAIIWLVTACARLSFMMYLLSIASASIVRTQNYRRFIPSIAALIFYIALLPNTLSDAIDFKDVVLEQRLPFLYGSILLLFTIVGYFKLWRKKRMLTKQTKPQSV